MNGRIYDPLLGRFLSADVWVQFPGILQSFNRYSYVDNNPLTRGDPSGFGWETIQMTASSLDWTVGSEPSSRMARGDE